MHKENYIQGYINYIQARISLTKSRRLQSDSLIFIKVRFQIYDKGNDKGKL